MFPGEKHVLTLTCIKGKIVLSGPGINQVKIRLQVREVIVVDNRLGKGNVISEQNKLGFMRRVTVNELMTLNQLIKKNVSDVSEVHARGLKQ